MTSPGMFPNRSFMALEAAKKASIWTDGHAPPTPSLATSICQPRVLPESSGIVPRENDDGPPLPAQLLAPAAIGQHTPSRSMSMLPTGASSQPSIIHDRSLAGLVL